MSDEQYLKTSPSLIRTNFTWRLSRVGTQGPDSLFSFPIESSEKILQTRTSVTGPHTWDIIVGHYVTNYFVTKSSYFYFTVFVRTDFVDFFVTINLLRVSKVLYFRKTNTSPVPVINHYLTPVEEYVPVENHFRREVSPPHPPSKRSLPHSYCTFLLGLAFPNHSFFHLFI